MENMPDQIEILYNKWISKTASEEEERQLLQLMEELGPGQDLLTPLLRQTWNELLQQENTFDERHRSIAQSIIRQYPAIPVEETPIRHISQLRRWIAAAVAVLLLGTSIYYLTRTQHTPPSVVAQAADIAPGHAGAILTLADGSQVTLDSIQNGVVALQGGATAKVVNGVLLYEGKGNNIVYNTMSTPKGRQFHVTLPDGTEVWLNASSSIRYPTVFAGNERNVEITGEAYFEVAKNKKMPFRLKVNHKAEIEVLGTHFNVNAYDNENTINTTLMEGSVRVSSQAFAVVLKPGQQAQRRANGISIVNNANIEKVLAWKNGFFNFDDVPFEEAMRKLERWYDIEVVFEKGVPDIQFEGKMTRDLPLSGLLIALERSDVHFRIEGRKLIVLP